VAIYPLPDGRSVEVELRPDGYRHARVEGEPASEIVGTPLLSTLAELLGYEVGHEVWPTWIDDLASEVEGNVGGH
jgi:hypothetical protein